MRELLELTACVLVCLAVLYSIQYVGDAQEARQIAAEARQEARDIAFEQRQREWGCVQPKSFESSVKRTD